MPTRAATPASSQRADASTHARTLLREVDEAPSKTELEAEQLRVNREVWGGDALVGEYARRDLRPVERLVLDRYRERFAGAVLELGCGAGRITGHLATLSDRVLAIDISPAMVDYCRRHYPSVTVEQGDLRDLTGLGAGAFDAVIAGNNVLDVLGDTDRRAALRDIGRVLAPGGIVVFSSHNRAYAPGARTLQRLKPRHLVRMARVLARLPARRRNRRRLAKLERDEPGYAIRNDSAHDFALVHYYVGRDAEAAQLAEEGFELLECLALDGERVAPGAPGERDPELHYVARRRGDQGAGLRPGRSTLAGSGH